MTIFPTRIALCIVLCGTFLGTVAAAATAQESQKFDVISLTAGINLIKAEVAAAPEQREQGLMFRQKMAPTDCCRR